MSRKTTNGGYGHVTWQQALDYVKKLNSEHYLGYSDWRLPNRKELRSLVDISRYNPALPAGHPFTNVQANGYWSSSTGAYSTSVAWVVNLWDGFVYGNFKSYGYYYYVWPVRAGQSGSFGSSGILNRFDITADGVNPIGPKAVNTWFPVTIRAVDAYGNVMTGYNGDVNIGSIACSANPITATLTNGVSTNLNVAINCICNNMKITAFAQGKYSESSPFNVTGIAGNHAYIGGKVTDGSERAIEGATVYLDSGEMRITSGKTDYTGIYQFTDAPPGSYTIYAEDSTGVRGRARNVTLTNIKPASVDLVIGSACNPNGLTPVLFVPGIMGSSIGGGGIYPILPKGSPDWYYGSWDTKSWGLHDPGRRTGYTFDPGWRRIIEDFENSGDGYKLGCTLFPAPYDWRISIDDAAENYLEKVINYAKLKAGTGKVNIVAHSMGGLVARAYIQSDHYKDKNDIEKLVMVGTPNNGPVAVLSG